MKKLDIISLSGDTLKDVSLLGVDGLIVSNTDNEDITFSFLIGPSKLHDTTSTTGAFFILKDIPIPVGSSFVWDDNGVLTETSNVQTMIRKYQNIGSRPRFVQDNSKLTFLIALGSGHTADVILKRVGNVYRS